MKETMDTIDTRIDHTHTPRDYKHIYVVSAIPINRNLNRPKKFKGLSWYLILLLLYTQTQTVCIIYTAAAHRHTLIIGEMTEKDE